MKTSEEMAEEILTAVGRKDDPIAPIIKSYLGSWESMIRLDTLKKVKGLILEEKQSLNIKDWWDNYDEGIISQIRAKKNEEDLHKK
jgi:hypothetical protein